MELLKSDRDVRFTFGSYRQLSEPQQELKVKRIFFMNNIQTILQSRVLQKPQGRHMAHEWQAFAYKTWKDYSNDPKELPKLIRFFKLNVEAHRPYLDAAYNFCIDYTGPIPKLRLFYWKFWQLKKNRQGS